MTGRHYFLRRLLLLLLLFLFLFLLHHNHRLALMIHHHHYLHYCYRRHYCYHHFHHLGDHQKQTSFWYQGLHMFYQAGLLPPAHHLHRRCYYHHHCFQGQLLLQNRSVHLKHHYAALHSPIELCILQLSTWIELVLTIQKNHPSSPLCSFDDLIVDPSSRQVPFPSSAPSSFVYSSSLLGRICWSLLLLYCCGTGICSQVLLVKEA